MFSSGDHDVRFSSRAIRLARSVLPAKNVVNILEALPDSYQGLSTEL